MGEVRVTGRRPLALLLLVVLVFACVGFAAGLGLRAVDGGLASDQATTVAGSS